MIKTPFADAEAEVLERNGTRLVRVRPQHDGDHRAWFTANTEAFRSAMYEHAAVMVKDCGIVEQSELAVLAEEISGRTLEYNERSTPRSRVTGKVYTSTEYPADQSIPQHNESAYSENWPHNVFFFCALAARTGGETPVADSAAVLERLPADLVRRFEEKGVVYTRTYRTGMGLSWQEGFQTDDKGYVESYCADHNIQTDWDGDLLRTRQKRQAVTVHPITGKKVWFNQAHLFHVHALPEDVREGLLEICGEDGLPRNAYYGDGTPITADELATILGVYDETTLAETWGTGDLLGIDNILTSHGRRPFTGDRKVLVAMTQREA
ncbi:TauD/TfdA family dioxygenase [Streptomyces anulatus]|uniref:TauD/TfdA family dioxygenase n=1 Tax=Streptomyces TaxID=1883 RepID=UPI000BF1B0C4|nr:MULTISPECIES: TauD/TfdA family dioxygenase [Streptomyces]MCX4489707.1 TauD/TfdA family dioxygenase [Streptomyces anulatus]MCX4504250.1 TauD/TfdA family dioxygenase [Streptomyces anulatus]MCX4520068.1 TauD/TfdA family dioxygenase [Streptomyces anulatus]MCX4602938.1 TauD/TfdA family dioxygenase [Streptomyces anulatus]WSI79302.1 TauD/TfdA family dioxygenase [Streptomyces anulatus]